MTRRIKKSVLFKPPEVRGCVRVDLTKPANGDRFEFDEVSKRMARSLAGIPVGAVVQLVVSKKTPLYDIRLPSGALVQIVTDDSATLRSWMNAISEGST